MKFNHPAPHSNRNRFRKFLAAGLALLTLGIAGHADVRMPNLFSDNMVLQQGMSVPVWGWADEEEQVTVEFQGQRLQTIAKDGKWMVRLRSLKPVFADAPETLTVEGKNRMRFQNVLVGEVWICSGQSNMQWPMRQAFEPEQDIASASNENLRLFTVERTKADEPQSDVRVKAQWLKCEPANVPDFTAVGYYFGRSLQASLKVPVGLIHSSWGGSPAEVWMSKGVLAANPAYAADVLEAGAASYRRYLDARAAYDKQAAALKAEGKRPTRQAPREPWRPTTLYNAMIYPLAPFAVKGAIWYQGESNAGRAWQYRTLFADMIKNWRSTWGQSEFYFMAVQLAPFDPKEPRVTEPGESAWAELREAQWLATKLPGVGLAVITDVGELKDIHPRKKGPVGERLAIAARGIAYQERGLVYSGPIFKQMSVKNNRAVLTFDFVGDGLEARDGELKGFALCGEDRRWVWAKAEITGGKSDQVIVSHPEVAKPVAVRYGWANFPEVNLWNKNGLPASPFRTDDFPMVTKPKDAGAKN